MQAVANLSDTGLTALTAAAVGLTITSETDTPVAPFVWTALQALFNVERSYRLAPVLTTQSPSMHDLISGLLSFLSHPALQGISALLAVATAVVASVTWWRNRKPGTTGATAAPAPTVPATPAPAPAQAQQPAPQRSLWQRQLLRAKIGFFLLLSPPITILLQVVILLAFVPQENASAAVQAELTTQDNAWMIVILLIAVIIWLMINRRGRRYERQGQPVIGVLIRADAFAAASTCYMCSIMLLIRPELIWIPVVAGLIATAITSVFGWLLLKEA